MKHLWTQTDLSFSWLCWGRLGSAAVSITLSPGLSACWLWDARTVTPKCVSHNHALCYRMSPEVLTWENEGWANIPPAHTSRDSFLAFQSKQMGVLFTGNLLGCQTQQSCLPHDSRITAGVSPPLPCQSWYGHPREMKWWISLPALTSLLENPRLNQEACLWYSSLSCKYYRCHFHAPKLLTRQHSYLIRHSTAIHIYLYLNSCPLYYTAGHASAPTPPY